MRFIQSSSIAAGLVSLASIIGLGNPVQAVNPIVQSIYTADPAPLVYNNRMYIFTGHDSDGSTSYNMWDWHIYSSVDMANWQHHGVGMSLSSFTWARDRAWAGQAIERNGRFYWYVPVRRSNGRMAIGVATSSNITGPYVDAIGAPSLENGEIDPTVFIDDDGQAYLYWGNPNLWYVKLNEDMVSYSGSLTQVPLTAEGFGVRTGVAGRPTQFEEAPWLYKRNGIYYMIYAAACCPENIQYSTGPSATGPWTYRGLLQPAEGTSSTNHVGIVDYKGVSYYVYHNSWLPGGGSFTRSVCVESFKYNADGTIPRIPMTRGGPAQVGRVNPYVRQEAEMMAWAQGVETEPSSQGGMEVTWINNGDYVRVIGVDFGSRGASSLSASVASRYEGNWIDVRLDTVDGPLVGSCWVPRTGGWQTWRTVSCPIAGAVGIHDVYFYFRGEGTGDLFNFDWWQFTAI